MERSIFYNSQNINDMYLDYYIIADDISASYCSLETYGVRIVKTVYLEGGGKTVESKQINNIFYKSADIERFMDIIVKNEVTPVTLPDVIDDYIAEYI